MQSHRSVKEFPDYFFSDLAEVQLHLYNTLYFPPLKEDEECTARAKVTAYVEDAEENT